MVVWMHIYGVALTLPGLFCIISILAVYVLMFVCLLHLHNLVW